MEEWDGESLLNATPVSLAMAGGRVEGHPGMNLTVYPETTPLEDNVWFRVFTIVSYTLVFIGSVFGNLLVIFVILCHKQMRSAVNFFLGNLAIADLCVGIFCVLPALFKYLSQYWWLGRAICKMHNFVQCVNYTCSIVILTVISVERYVIISHPLWNKFFGGGGWRIRSTVVSVVWLASIAYSVPTLFQFDLREASSSNQTLYFCLRSNFLIPIKWYAMIDLTLLYALPLLLITIVYVRISMVLWRSSRLEEEVKTRSVSGEVSPQPQPKSQAPMKGGEGGGWRGRCKGPLVWCSRGCRGSEERGQSPWHESIALKLDCQDEGLKKTDAASGGAAGNTVFSQLRDGLHHEWTIELPIRKMEPFVELTNRHPRDPLSPSSSSSSPSTITPPPPASASATTKVSACQPYQLRRLRTNLHQTPLSESNQATRKDHHGRPILTTVLNNGRLKHSVVSTTASTSTGSDCRTPSKVPLALLRRRRVIRLLIAIVVSFAVFTLPHHVHVQYYMWAPHPFTSFYGQMYIPPITTLLFYASSAINPILYAFISRKFRRAIVTIDWRYIWRKLGRGEASSSERYTLN